MRHANSDKLSERALGAMDAAVYAAEEMARLRAVNAELLAACESPGQAGRWFYDGPALLEKAAEYLRMSALHTIADALVEKAALERVAIAEAHAGGLPVTLEQGGEEE